MLICATSKWSNELEQVLEALKLYSDSTSIRKVDLTIQKFADGEILPTFNECISDQDLVIIGSTDQPHENIFEMVMIVDAARRSRASRIIVIIPYFGYARQDRRGDSRCSHGSKVMANMLESAGVSQVITFDIHALQIDGNFNIPFVNVTTDKTFGATLQSKFSSKINNLILCSPDAGGMKRVELINKIFDNSLDVVTILKKRSIANTVDSMQLIGDVQGKDVLIIDDILDTGGTLCKATQYLLDEGANSVSACITHGLLSRDACKLIAESNLSNLIMSTSVLGIRDKIVSINEMQRELNPATETTFGIVNINGKIAGILYKLANSLSLK